MNDHVQETIQQALDLRRRGYYGDAVRQLEELYKVETNSLITAVELAETLFVQGYPARAFAIIDILPTYPSSRYDPLIILAKLLRSYVRLYTTPMEFKASLEAADTAYIEFLTTPYSKSAIDTTIRIDVYYCRFWHLATKLGAHESQGFQEKSIPRLKSAYPVLIRQKDFHLAYSVARTYSTCSNDPQKDSLLKNLANDVGASDVFRAQAQLFLARSLLTDSERSEQAQLCRSARGLFERSGHAHGIMDAQMVTLCRPPLTSDNEFPKDQIQNLINAYRALDYPNGVATSLTQLLETGKKLNQRKSSNLFLSDLESLCRCCGNELTGLNVRLGLIARMSTVGGNHGKVIQAGRALWHELEKSDCAFLRGQAALIVSLAYFALKDRDLMMLWSQRAESDLTETGLSSTPSFIRIHNLATISGLKQCFEMLSFSTDSGTDGYSPETAASRFDDFLSHALEQGSQGSEALSILDMAIDQWEFHISRFSGKVSTSTMLAKVRQAQAIVLTFRASMQVDIEQEMAAIPLFKEAQRLYLKDREIPRALFVLQHEAQLQIRVACKFELIQDEQVEVAYQNARNLYNAVIDAASKMGITAMEVDGAYWVAFCEYQLWLKGYCSSENISDSLLRAEDLANRQRQEVSILQGIAAITAKRQLASNKRVRLYTLALQVLNALQMTSDAWKWVQKSKARSLSDILGLGALVPQKILDPIQQNPGSLKDFEHETFLANALTEASEIDRFKAKQQLESHQEAMRKDPILAELLNFREGNPISLEELSEGILGDYNIVFVDWVAVHSDIYIYIARKNEYPIVEKLALRIQQIERWVREQLNAGQRSSEDIHSQDAFSALQEEDDTDEGPLRELDALIGPLYSHCQPEELLVFCPSGIMHALPLHALRFGAPGNKQLLIERNLVVYCASLTTFIQCCRRAEGHVVGSAKNHFLAVYEQETGQASSFSATSDPVERNQIYESTNRLASKMKGESFCGKDVTARTLKSSLESADWVHFLGHFDYSNPGTTEQGLLVSSDHNNSRATFDTLPNYTPPGIVTVKDLFEFRIRALHITLLACSSAAQEFQAGDEPLGLLTAFLSAGASSVLGTLWPVQTSTARNFSLYFYDHLRRSAKKPTGKQHEIYNLAYALREAVLDLRGQWEFRQPYHWASFVLHGAWFSFGGSEAEKTTDTNEAVG